MVDANMDKGVRLMPANEKNTDYKPIEVTVENDFLIRVGFFKFEEEDAKEFTSSS